MFMAAYRSSARSSALRTAPPFSVSVTSATNLYDAAFVSSLRRTSRKGTSSRKRLATLARRFSAYSFMAVLDVRF